LEEAYRGATKALTLQTLTLGPEGQALPQTKNIEVKIPPGVTHGTHIRLAGQGGAGIGGGPAGDLFLRVRIAPHPVFQLDGPDLQTTLVVTPWEAALGAKVEVPTLDGAVKMTLPPGTQGGQRLRLRGKGMSAGGNERGSLYVVIQVAVPKALTAKERELFEQLQRVSAFNPRGAGKERA
jgi:curved DNA-binding protein